MSDGPGRPTKCTPEITAKVCAEIKRVPSTLEGAAVAAGISERTFFYWMKWGEEQPDSEYATFLQEVTHAKIASERLLVQRIAADEDWRSDAWILERRFPERWGKDRRAEKQDNKITVEFVDAQYDAQRRAEEE